MLQSALWSDTAEQFQQLMEQRNRRCCQQDLVNLHRHTPACSGLSTPVMKWSTGAGCASIVACSPPRRWTLTMQRMLTAHRPKLPVGHIRSSSSSSSSSSGSSSSSSSSSRRNGGILAAATGATPISRGMLPSSHLTNSTNSSRSNTSRSNSTDSSTSAAALPRGSVTNSRHLLRTSVANSRPTGTSQRCQGRPS